MNLTDNSLGKWAVTLMDVGDESGDCYIEFPKELMEKIDWHEGDVIEIDIVDDHLRLTKLNG